MADRPIDKQFIELRLIAVPWDVYEALADAQQEEKKRLYKQRRSTLTDGLVKIVRGYKELIAARKTDAE